MAIAIYENGKLIRVVTPKPQRLELVFVRGNGQYSSVMTSMSQGLLRQPKPKHEKNGKEAKYSDAASEDVLLKHAPKK